LVPRAGVRSIFGLTNNDGKIMNRSIHSFYDKALLWLLLTFVTAHLVNHLIIAFGAPAHIAVMDGLRDVYRNPLVEILLIWGIARQIWAGIRQLRRFGIRKPKGPMRVLILTGLYLIFFLVIHISAVLQARWTGVDTNLYFGTAGYRVWPIMLFFYPYYFTAIFCVFAHTGTVLWMRTRAKDAPRAQTIYRTFNILGLVMATILTLMLSGLFTDFTIPQAYLASFQ
jgi:hypothetical protein